MLQLVSAVIDMLWQCRVDRCWYHRRRTFDKKAAIRKYTNNIKKCRETKVWPIPVGQTLCFSAFFIFYEFWT